MKLENWYMLFPKDLSYFHQCLIFSLTTFYRLSFNFQALKETFSITEALQINASKGGKITCFLVINPYCSPTIELTPPFSWPHHHLIPAPSLPPPRNMGSHEKKSSIKHDFCSLELPQSSKKESKRGLKQKLWLPCSCQKIAFYFLLT